MKNLKKTFILFTMIFAIYSCENNNISQPNNPTTNEDGGEENYYVKYTAECVCRYNVNMEVKVNTEQGLTTFLCEKKFSETFGPVPKGFECKIVGIDPSSTTENYSDITYTSIYLATKNLLP